MRKFGTDHLILCPLLQAQRQMRANIYRDRLYESLFLAIDLLDRSAYSQSRFAGYHRQHSHEQSAQVKGIGNDALAARIAIEKRLAP